MSAVVCPCTCLVTDEGEVYCRECRYELAREAETEARWAALREEYAGRNPGALLREAAGLSTKEEP